MTDPLVQAAPKDAGTYTYFKLRSAKLTISRRGKESVFKRGDPLGWRLSGSGKFIRLISPITGPNIIFSLELTDDVLKWLDKQDPNAKRKVGQRKSDKPEDGANVLEGYVVTDGTWFYKMEPKPVRSKKKEAKVLYGREPQAQRLVRKFPERKLKVLPVYTKDLGQVMSAVETAGPLNVDSITSSTPGFSDAFLSAMIKELRSNMRRTLSYSQQESLDEEDAATQVDEMLSLFDSSQASDSLTSSHSAEFKTFFSLPVSKQVAALKPLLD